MPSFQSAWPAKPQTAPPSGRDRRQHPHRYHQEQAARPAGSCRLFGMPGARQSQCHHLTRGFVQHPHMSLHSLYFLAHSIETRSAGDMPHHATLRRQGPGRLMHLNLATANRRGIFARSAAIPAMCATPWRGHANCKVCAKWGGGCGPSHWPFRHRWHSRWPVKPSAQG